MASDVKLDGDKVLFEGELAAGKITATELHSDKIVFGEGNIGNLVARILSGNFAGRNRLIIQNQSVSLTNPKLTRDLDKGIALFHSDDDELILNENLGYNGGVIIKGDLAVEDNLSVKLAVTAESANISKQVSAQSLVLTKEIKTKELIIFDLDKLSSADKKLLADAKAKVETAKLALDKALAAGIAKPLLDAITALNSAEKKLKSLTETYARSAIVLSDNDVLLINPNRSRKGGVAIDGDVKVNGVLTQASSRELKEDITGFSSQEAAQVLNQLNPVKFFYKESEKRELRAGFIAEEAPDLVTSFDRKGVSAMDVVAVLTKVVQEQQKTISELATEVNILKKAVLPA